jgi:hypothetical protein
MRNFATPSQFDHEPTQRTANMNKEKSTPAPLETEPGKQMDDNADDLGNKSGNGKIDQPTDAGRGKPGNKPD